MLKEIMAKILERRNLTNGEMTYCMDLIMSGQVSEIQMASFLTAMKIKGETVAEVLSAAQVMREKCEKVDLGTNETLDTCGTGGDGHNTFNFSTAAAIVAAAAGVKVVKHGNRSATSKCGSADVLEKLGVNIMQDPSGVKESVEKCNIGFMFAPLYHKSMKHVVNTRKQLGFRTIFNILGPLANPASATRQIMGVYNPDLTWISACALRQLGVKRALVFHGYDGMDEISLTGPTQVREVNDGRIESYVINPEDFGFNRCSLPDLKGGTAEDNANIMKRLFKGEKGPMRDALLLNSGAALYAAGMTADIKEGIIESARLIDTGKVYETMNRFINVSNSAAVCSGGLS
ncbi:MAG TPA: anthranilate phosphoribosyltransferase [Clostridia bacterium]